MEIINNVSHNVKILERNIIELSGINKIISFTSEEFLLDCCMGQIVIKGKNLEIMKINTEDGNTKIKGVINSLIYYDDKRKNKDEGFITKLFK